MTKYLPTLLRGRHYLATNYSLWDAYDSISRGLNEAVAYAKGKMVAVKINKAEDLPSPTTDRGTYFALIFALVAERLSSFYEHDQWLTKAQGASLASDWLARNKRSLPIDTRRHLSGLSDQLARQIAGTLSREAGLYTVHEMMESLDPNYQSEIARSLMLECERVLDNDLSDQVKA